MQAADGIVAVVKQDCPTCVLVDPILLIAFQEDLHVKAGGIAAAC